MATSRKTTKGSSSGRNGAASPADQAGSALAWDSGNEDGTLGLFGDVYGAVTLGVSLGTVSKKLAANGVEILERTIRAMKPRDQLERMVIEQLVWTHMRIQRLTLKSSMLGKPELAMAFDDQINKAMNTYRRTLMALCNYRRGPDQRPLVAVQQVNESGSGDVVISPPKRRKRKNSRTK